ncbi:c-type cytochrome [Lacicoccus alkaliphilus]|uniref:Cytochrome c551 n=1 Tax=Lacicoccus alkaliphilus DSM 16010 TaxID=1123231 RepID=A0A1M7AK17_9BACL|nr:cytochrome c [Salinicoccus alkaliphilus]SHL43122.1 cytochrome c551 [Salinicoccus alkaliphilus DSM 16010]
MDLKKYLMAGGLSLVLVLGACGGDDGADETDEAATEEETTGDTSDDAADEESAEEETAGEDAAEEDDGEASTGDVDAEGIAQNSCASCHGGDFSGGMGPALAGTDMNEDEFNDIVRNGEGSMPAFSEDQIDDEELSALYTYFSEY